MLTVFGACDPAATRVLDAAVAAARRLGHGHLGTEHVLLALAADEGPTGAALRCAGVTPDRVEEAHRGCLAPARRPGELLATLGVDLDDVRAAAVRTFGDAALERVAARRRRRRDRRCVVPSPLLAGRVLAVAPRMKQVMERAGAKARVEGAAAVTPRHLLLAILDIDEALATRILVHLGVDLADLRSSLAA